jgi:hypothetical protein
MFLASSQNTKLATSNMGNKNVRAKAPSPTNGLSKEAPGAVQQMSGLPFRSYQTGTLNPGKFDLSGSTSKIQPFPASSSKNPLSARSVAFSPSTSNHINHCMESPAAKRVKNVLATRPLAPRLLRYSPHGSISQTTSSKHTETTLSRPTSKTTSTAVTTPFIADTAPSSHEIKTIRTFVTRADKSKKDVIITFSGISHNVVRVKQMCPPSGASYYVNTDEFLPGNYNFVDTLTKKTNKESIAFWTGNWVEIIVDINELNRDEGGKGKEHEEEVWKKQIGTVEMMNKLGPDFIKYTRTIIISIQFPQPANHRAPNKVTNVTKAQQESPAYQAIQNIANMLKEFQSLRKLDIVLYTPAYTRNPLTLEQLNYALPFYELPFTGWELKWQNTYMSRPETVLGWPIMYLDIERGKIDREIERAMEEKMFARAR